MNAATFLDCLGPSASIEQVSRRHRDLPWPDLLAFWGTPNLQVINRRAHVEKCAAEAADRARSRTRRPPSPSAGVVA